VAAGLALGLCVPIAAASRYGVALLAAERCAFATADGRVTLHTDQAGNAATIVDVAVRRQLPERAAVIALATAIQESKLRNLDHGDRDSLGLFQQRPSQGWGTAAEVSDPRYAAGRFYQALVVIPGYGDLPLTVAAQEVQRSAAPQAYAAHEADATIIARALLAPVPGAVTCTVRDPDRLSGLAPLRCPPDVADVADGSGGADRAGGAAGLRRAWGRTVATCAVAPPS
jgi:hypothetical protein